MWAGAPQLLEPLLKMAALLLVVAGKIGEATGGENGEMSRAVTLAIYEKIGWISIGVAVLVLLVAPVVKRWMHLDTLRDAEEDGEGAQS